MTTARICRFDKAVPYSEAVTLQKRLVEYRIADAIPDTLLLLQHPPTITLGRRGRREHLLVSEEKLHACGIALETSARGGDVTYHAPGQWVLYPILKLGPREMGAHGYLHALENIAIGTANTFGVEATRRDGMAGAWCPSGKFAAIGFKFTRWVTWHGLSLNVDVDLSGFDLIVGCGLVGETVSSLKAVLQENTPSMEEVGDEIIRQAETVLARTLTPIRPDEM